MGLEMAEVAMEVEDVFSIAVSEGSPIMPRVGDLNSFILLQLSARNWDRKPGVPEPKWTEAEVWKRLLEIICLTFPVPPESITKETRFVEDLGAG